MLYFQEIIEECLISKITTENVCEIANFSSRRSIASIREAYIEFCIDDFNYLCNLGRFNNLDSGILNEIIFRRFKRSFESS